MKRLNYRVLFISSAISRSSGKLEFDLHNVLVTLLIEITSIGVGRMAVMSKAFCEGV
jgi:hypothetical protein